MKDTTMDDENLLFPADMAAQQIGARTSFSDYNPLIPGYMVMPKTMICVSCQKSVSFSPFSVITYMNRKMVLEKHCDACTQLKINEGRIKLGQWQEKLKKQQEEKDQMMTRRLATAEEEKKKAKPKFNPLSS